jgi:hypothetical protein
VTEIEDLDEWLYGDMRREQAERARIGEEEKKIYGPNWNWELGGFYPPDIEPDTVYISLDGSDAELLRQLQEQKATAPPDDPVHRLKIKSKWTVYETVPPNPFAAEDWRDDYYDFFDRPPKEPGA